MKKTLKDKLILITGASEGIGAEIASQAISAGARTILVARNEVKLKQVAMATKGQYTPEIAVVNLADGNALDTFIAQLDAKGVVPDMLINNAGAGASGSFVDDDWNKIMTMMRVNMAALARLSHWAANRMKSRKQGAIVNLSAAVATRPTPYFAAYAATKAFVSSLSEAMSAELRPYGVSVSTIHPPAVKTSFAEADKADLRNTLVLKLFPAVTAKTVARVSLKAGLNGTRTVVVGPIAAIILFTARIMPRGLDLAFMGLLFKRKPTMKSGANVIKLAA